MYDLLQKVLLVWMHRLSRPAASYPSLSFYCLYCCLHWNCNQCVCSPLMPPMILCSDYSLEQAAASLAYQVVLSTGCLDHAFPMIDGRRGYLSTSDSKPSLWLLVHPDSVSPWCSPWMRNN